MITADRLQAPRRSNRRIYPWYDSVWLTNYTRAKAIITEVKPEALSRFVDAFDVFRTADDFEVKLLNGVFDDDVLQEIRTVMDALHPTALELHEARSFGRFVVHDHPFFTELQNTTLPLVSEAVGAPVEASYNFLSRYTHRGVCAPHMDSPQAKWTLDLCVDQSDPWPISLSQVVPWPEAGQEWPDVDWENAVKSAPGLRFTSYAPHPGQALPCSGSSQWHYREAIEGVAQRAFCDLLFFHFIPRGTAELVRPEQ